MPEELQKRVIMVLRPEDRPLYKYDCEYLVVDNDIGIAKTRETIYRLAGKSRYMIIDDDIQIYQHTILDNIWLSIIKWIESSYDVNPIRFTGYSLWLLQSAWPGLATFLLAMILFIFSFRDVVWWFHVFYCKRHSAVTIHLFFPARKW